MTRDRPGPAWSDYEQQVFETLKEHLPSADIQKNVKIRGRYSKRLRQIDMLISEETPTGVQKTVIDAKFYKKRVDVKVVDEFVGLVDDVGAKKGLLVTNSGYSKAALKRAFYCPDDLELDVLSFAELQQWQGFVAIPYAGDHAFLVSAPLGWVIDISRREGRLATMYQRGLDAATAQENKEFLYVNFWDRSEDQLTAAELDRQQLAHMRLDGAVSVRRRRTVSRPNAVTRLRIADVKRYRCLEVTGFVEFEDVIFFAVLLTSRERQRPNIRRLESVLQRAMPMTLRHNNADRISSLQDRLKGVQLADEKAGLLCEIGLLQREMGNFEDARESFVESLSLVPGYYEAMKGLIAALTKLNDRKCVTENLARLLRLDPRNPTVFNDMFVFARSARIDCDEGIDLIEALRLEYPNDHVVQGNCDFYSGNLVANAERAKRFFISARDRFSQALPADHQVFVAITVALRRLASRKKRGSRKRPK